MRRLRSLQHSLKSGEQQFTIEQAIQTLKEPNCWNQAVLSLPWLDDLEPIAGRVVF